MVCWGRNESRPNGGAWGPLQPGQFHHSCGLRSDGNVVCWGRNTTARTDAPVGPLRPGQRGLRHSPGYERTAAWSVARTNTARRRRRRAATARSARAGTTVAGCVTAAWSAGARNRDGQTEAPAGRYSQVSAGEVHSCGLRSDGGVVCWGANLFANLHAAGDRIFAREQGHVSDEVNGRIVARRLADGARGCGFQPEGAERILPRRSLLPGQRSGRSLAAVESGFGRWSGDCGGSTRVCWNDGRIEFCLEAGGGERILPRSRTSRRALESIVGCAAR